MKKTVRVLQFPGSLLVGGVESMLMNIYRNIDKNNYHFDFCVVRDNDSEGPYDQEIKNNGGKLFYIPQIKSGVFAYLRAIKKIIKENGPYDVVHVHSVFNGIFAIIAAKSLGIKTRVYHVHNTNDASLRKFPFKNTYKKIARWFIKRKSTHHLACGKEAANYVYGKKFAKKKGIVLNNALNLNEFYAYSKANIQSLREELNIPKDALVIGNAARFVEIKNQIFLINLVHEMSKKQNVFLLLAGDGETRKLCEQRALELEIFDKVKFLGNISNMPKFYNTLDVFVLPSFFEGLPVSSIEAQACGIPSLQSDTITLEADMGLDLLYSFNLKTPLSDVVDLINKITLKRIIDNDLINKSVSEKGYNIKNTVKVIQKVYDA